MHNLQQFKLTKINGRKIDKKRLKVTKQWTTVTSLLIRSRDMSSILYHKHFSDPITRICQGYYMKTAPVI